eukprot:Rhum_TRINITY_DN19090_c0_g1::Rhum_TRINITY_DN19090_c0_g1_i1::g.169224::m.169224/K14406/CSTF1; cleavage stimulation factor subunit 1
MSQMSCTLTDKKNLYRLMTRQLLYDGFPEAASAVQRSTVTSVPDVDPEGDELARIVSLAAHEEAEAQAKREALEQWNTSYSYFGQGEKMFNRYLASHPKEVRCLNFSPDGNYLVAGDAGGTMQMYLTELMVAEKGEAKTASRAALARVYEGNGFSVEDVCFHPDKPMIACGTREGKIHMYSYSRPREKRPLTTLDDEYMIRSLAMHPLGKYVLSGTEQSVAKLWDIERKVVFTPPMDLADTSAGMVNVVDFSPDGKTFVAGQSDGCLKIFDPSVPNWAVVPIKKCHSGVEVTSVQHSKTGTKLLTAGKDGCVRVFDLRTYGCLQVYGKPRRIDHKAIARFTSHEDAIVVVLNEKEKVSIIDRGMSDKLQLTPTQKNPKRVRCIATSPLAPFIATGDDGFKMKFWTPEDGEEAEAVVEEQYSPRGGKGKGYGDDRRFGDRGDRGGHGERERDYNRDGGKGEG